MLDQKLPYVVHYKHNFAITELVITDGFILDIILYKI